MRENKDMQHGFKSYDTICIHDGLHICGHKTYRSIFDWSIIGNSSAVMPHMYSEVPGIITELTDTWLLLQSAQEEMVCLRQYCNRGFWKPKMLIVSVESAKVTKLTAEKKFFQHHACTLILSCWKVHNLQEEVEQGKERIKELWQINSNFQFMTTWCLVHTTQTVCTNWENMCTNWENMCTNWGNMCTTQTERTCALTERTCAHNSCAHNSNCVHKLREYVHKLREHVHNWNWENMCTNWGNMCTTETERTCAQTEGTCAQLKLREHVHTTQTVCTNWENMCTNWGNMCTTQTERTCAQTGRTCAHNSNWENMCTNKKLRDNTHMFLSSYSTVFGFLSTLAPHS